MSDFTTTKPTNGLAIVGFVLAIVGIFSSGILCPIGLIISLIALGREPKGFAIEGETAPQRILFGNNLLIDAPGEQSRLDGGCGR